MRKKLATFSISVVLTAGIATTAYAGWEQDGSQWKYRNDNVISFCENTDQTYD